MLQVEKISKSKRFGIIGAGAAGLTSAHYLKQKGYENITILERNSRSGGKCLSFVDDIYYFDLGAILLGPKNLYREVLAITEMLKIGYTPVLKDRIFCGLDGARFELIEKREIIRLVWEIIKFKLLHFKHRFDPIEMERLSEHFYEPFSSLVSKYHLSTLEKFFKIPSTSFGYGYLNEVPAAYLLWYLSASLIPALAQQFNIVPTGIASIWEKLADQHTVKYEQEILKVERSNTVKISTRSDAYEFDKLIVACPLDETFVFLDNTSEEQDLFSKIRYYDYFNFVFSIENLPSSSRCYIPENMQRSRHGHLLVLAKKYPEVNLYIAYAFGNRGQSEQDVEKTVREDLDKLGAVVGKTFASAYRKFFPHVSSKDMQAGFYKRLEALQGSNHTYYVGEICTFSLLEAVTRYSKNLVNKFF